jgi:hypothetical protein
MRTTFNPMVCKVDGLHPHLAQQMADAREFHQKQDGISPQEGESAAGEERRNAWTPGGIAIDQVSKYKYLGVVYQEDGSWQAHAQRLAKMQAAYGYWRPLLSCSSLPTKVDCSWFRPSSIPRSCMRKCGHDEGGQRQDVSGRKESSPQHSSPASPRLLF